VDSKENGDERACERINVTGRRLDTAERGRTMSLKSPVEDLERADPAPATTPSPPAAIITMTDSFSPVPVAGLLGPQRHGTDPDDVLGGTTVPAETRSILTKRRGSGASLPEGVTRRMEAGFGTPLDHVRVHADAEADGLTRQLQATAFTLGSDIYFSRGSYAPTTGPGQRLLAHELAHVAQQSAGTGGSGSGLTVGHAADPAEAQADAMADTVLRSLRLTAGAELRRSHLRRWSAGTGAAEHSAT
jgi:hypothetical protein